MEIYNLKKAVLHIGVHKTGTSFIQGCLSKNRSWLLERRVFYEPGDKVTAHHPTNHHTLIQRFEDGSRRIEEGTDLILDMLAEANRRNCDTVLLSSELLTSGTVEIEPIVSTLTSNVDEVVVVAYMRRPDDIVASAYNQLVRSFAQRRVEPFSMANKGYDPSYKRTILRWIRSDVRLVLAPYDSTQWMGGTIVSDFLSMLDLFEFGGLDLTDLDESENRSLPMPLLEILRRFNQLAVSNHDHKKFVADLYDVYSQMPEAFNTYDLLLPEHRLAMRRELAANIQFYRPYFRTGFDEDFLTNPDLSDGAE